MAVGSGTAGISVCAEINYVVNLGEWTQMVNRRAHALLGRNDSQQSTWGTNALLCKPMLPLQARLALVCSLATPHLVASLMV